MSYDTILFENSRRLRMNDFSWLCCVDVTYVFSWSTRNECVDHIRTSLTGWCQSMSILRKEFWASHFGDTKSKFVDLSRAKNLQYHLIESSVLLTWFLWKNDIALSHRTRKSIFQRKTTFLFRRASCETLQEPALVTNGSSVWSELDLWQTMINQSIRHDRSCNFWSSH